MTFRSDEFDPYYRWLGIPKDQRPPNHYQLLGIAATEDDRKTIEDAIQRQTNLIKTQREPEQDEIANRVLYEIQEAGITVLDPYCRKEYDASIARSKPVARQPLRAEPLPPYTPSRSVGEETEIARSYFGIVSILLCAFIIMAVVSFMLPWRRVVFGIDPEKEAPAQAQNVQPPPANGIGQQPVPIARQDEANKGAGPQEADVPPAEFSPDGTSEVASSGETDASLITTDVVVQSVNVTGRVMTVSRNSKSAEFDVSRKVEVILNGTSSTLETLAAGQEATITFDPEHDIVVKIELQSNEFTSVESAETQRDDLATIQGTITAVDLEQRSITVTRNSKITTFDLSRRTEVFMDGQRATLDSLRPDQSASITFNPEFNVITRIKFTGVQP